MKKKIYELIYLKSKQPLYGRYIDIVLNFLILVASLISIGVYSKFQELSYYNFFVGGDFMWGAFAIYLYILGGQIFSKHDYTRKQVIVLLICGLLCVCSISVYFAIKFSPNSVSYSEGIFWASLAVYLLAIILNWGCKVIKII